MACAVPGISFRIVHVVVVDARGYAALMLGKDWQPMVSLAFRAT